MGHRVTLLPASCDAGNNLTPVLALAMLQIKISQS
jgi:hypothetical protein